MPEPVRIRFEDTANSVERTTIRAIIEAAFGGADEAEIVDKLRGDDGALLSLVAEVDGSIVGHLLFSRMAIDAPGGSVSAVALAPLAVRPDLQRTGIGGKLVRHGLEILRERGEKIVIVAGHPAYYPKFGFSAEKARLLVSPFPPEAFMALELAPGALDGVQGAVVYHPAFGS
jgi:putative acetyltransferase